MQNLDFIPPYLRPYIAHQDYALYTHFDHAAWRFILQLSQRFYKKHAHPSYLSGLEATGISLESIPRISEMDQKLSRHGWRAVPVNGYIPPRIFMEFQSLGILPIACEMRDIENIAYTPAPDIVHEAAGHAPILADPDFAAYLKAYGELSIKAIHSKQDHALYESVRKLSQIKEAPLSTKEEIQAAEQHVSEAAQKVRVLSEAAQLARLNWWSVEYGLCGEIESPIIYGAGLLSSMSESYHCLNTEVLKLPFTTDCIHTSFDVTKPQPQLYVTKDFKNLVEILKEFESTMSFRLGGQIGVARAIQSESVCTIQLDSGLEMSGVLSDAYFLDSKNIKFLKFTSPVQLSFQGRELEGHGTNYHSHGFSSPLGIVKGYNKDLSQFTSQELSSLPSEIIFESGYKLIGQHTGAIQRNGKTLLITFAEATVLTSAGKIAYDPTWGPFDLACGSSISSVYGGPADREKYPTQFEQEILPMRTNLTPDRESLNALYKKTKELREKLKTLQSQVVRESVVDLHQQLQEVSKKDWLLRYELLEILLSKGAQSNDLCLRLREECLEIARRNPLQKEMIERGLEMLQDRRT